MHARPTFLCLVAIYFWAIHNPDMASGQSSELMEAYNNFNTLSQQERYSQAEPYAKEALRLGTEEFGPNDPTTAVLLNNLALLYQAQGRYAEAEPLHQRSLAINEKALGPEHPNMTSGQSSELTEAYPHDPSKTTFDVAYQDARLFGASPTKGIVLHLHGCDGLYVESGDWQREWIDLMVANGFHVVAPNSFADYRPSMSCAYPYPNKREIYDQRVRQTVYAIDMIRRDYPGKPVIVWGHSEGAGVANLLDQAVAGIITTGYQCGFSGFAETKIAPGVPMLIIQGSANPYIEEVVSWVPFDDLAALCAHVFRNHDLKPQRIVVDGMAHNPVFSEAGIRRGVVTFLDHAAQ